MKIVKLSTDSKTKKYQKKEIEFYIQQVKRGTLDHPNIIGYFAFVEYKTVKEHCVFMELCDTTLRQMIEDREWGGNDEEFKKHIIRGICNGVNHLHQNEVIHRDINPSNILLKNEGRIYPTVKIADFNVYTIHDGKECKLTHTLDIGQPY